MPISVTCSACWAELTAPDAAAGKRVKCPKCKAPIAVPDPNGFDVVDAPAPARPAARATPARPNDDPPRRRPRDEEEDDDRPRSRRRVVDEDDEDDDRPGRKKKRSMLPLLLVGGAVGLFLACGGLLGFVYFFFGPKDDPPRFPQTATAPVATPAVGGVNWVTFEGPDIPFVARFPNAAPQKTNPLASITDPNERKMAEALGPIDFWVREDGGRKYAVMVRVFPAGTAPPANRARQVLDAAVEGYKMTSGEKAAELDSQTGDWKGAPFKQVTLRLPAGEIHLVRMILTGGTLYQLLVEGDASLGATDTTAGQFFDGFEPKPKAESKPKTEPKRGTGLTPRGRKK